MNRLTPQIKAFIVTRLACYDTPSHIAKAVKEEFGVEVSRQLVRSYDPTCSRHKPAARWVAMFEQSRAAFLSAIHEVPIAHSAVRLRRLNRMADRAEDRGNDKLAADFLRQAAEEVGGLLTNRRELTGAGGGALLFDRDMDDYSQTELVVMLLGTLTPGERSAAIESVNVATAALAAGQSDAA